MKRREGIEAAALAGLAGLGGLLAGRAMSAPASAAVVEPSHEQFVAASATVGAYEGWNRSPAGSIAIVGDSRTRDVWNMPYLGGLLDPVPGIEGRGISGLQTRELSLLADLVLRARPRVVVLAAGLPDFYLPDADPRATAARIRAVRSLFGKTLQQSILPVGRAARLPRALEAVNADVHVLDSMLAQDDGYLEIRPDLVDADGWLRSDLTVSDGLHFNEAGVVTCRRALLREIARTGS